jgi:hypothetical protein
VSCLLVSKLATIPPMQDAQLHRDMNGVTAWLAMIPVILFLLALGAAGWAVFKALS